MKKTKRYVTAMLAAVLALNFASLTSAEEVFTEETAIELPVEEITVEEPIQEEVAVPVQEQPVQEEVAVPAQEQPVQEEVAAPAQEQPVQEEVAGTTPEQPVQEEVAECESTANNNHPDSVLNTNAACLFCCRSSRFCCCHNFCFVFKLLNE